MSYSNNDDENIGQNDEVKQIELPEICIGCGAVKQSKNINSLGYTSKIEQAYCFRCFELKYHNQIVDYEWNANHFKDLMSFLSSDQNNYFCYLVDVFDLIGSRSIELEKMMSKSEVCLIINKIDLIARLTGTDEMIEFIKKYFRNTKLKLSNVFLISGLKNYGLDELNAHLMKIEKTIYFVGCSNSGKSQLLNALLKLNQAKQQLTVSNYPATTMGVLPVNLSDGKTVYDTPGLINYRNIINYVAHDECYDNSIVNQPLKAITFQLKPEQTIIFEALGSISYLGAEDISLHIYMNSKWTLHRTSYDHFPEYWKFHHADNLLKLKPATEMEVHLITINPSEFKQSLYIAGCGWITFQTRSTFSLELFIPNDVDYKIVSPAII